MDNETIMGRALAAARDSLDKNEFPVGAALCVDGRLLAVTHNAVASTRSFIAHAETVLLMNTGRQVEMAGRAGTGPGRVTIYTTLEPCLMCLTACAHSRVARVVYACRDPVAGAGHLMPPQPFYRENWPRLEHDGRLERQSAELLLRFTRDRAGWETFHAAIQGILDETL